jgi:hypothetical protein
MTNGSNCPCDTFVFPETIYNAPGLPAIRYRAGDFVTLREALLQALPGEVELANWKPTASGDLALQLIEWWAYLGDIVTFYNERIANEDYLRTTVLDQSVRRLVSLLGYRPRPGIGATATLAALVSAKLPLSLPQGLAVQSKPGPGSSPQIFELTAATTLQPLDHVSADPVPSQLTLGADGRVLLAGTVGSIKNSDELVVVRRGWNGTDSNYAVANVVGIQSQNTPRGATNTQVSFGAGLGLPSGASPSGYRLLRSNLSAQAWQYAGSDSALVNNGDGTGTLHLNSVARQVQPGTMILFDASGAGLGSQLASVKTYTETIWYANSPDDPPTTPPDAKKNIPAISILHSQITFTPVYTGSAKNTQLVIRYGWQDVGTLIPAPSATFTGTPAELDAVSPPTFPPGSAQVLLEDANSVGESATGLAGADTTTVQLSGLPSNPPSLAAPVNVLYNLLQVTRGKTVSNEVLGSGDASVANQEFVLSKSPLTYLLSPISSSGENYASTLQVQVNGVYWTEAPSFYGQAPDATIFVTREDENQKTHVQFGDGVNGARLPTGLNNVIANYRFGSGAVSPAASTLTVIVNAQPGLTAIRNPVAAGGGADPQPSSQIRKYAPESVLAFGRAVSGDDYETIASLTPGVSRANAIWGFDPVQQRSMVTVYVGDDQGAVAAAQTALAADSDPNRPVTVLLAQPTPVQLQFTLEIDSTHVPDAVVAAVQQALIDPDTGLFGANRIGIGEIIYRSRIFAACLSVPGALAVHDLHFDKIETGWTVPMHGYHFNPGTGYWFSLQTADLNIMPEVNQNAG